MTSRALQLQLTPREVLAPLQQALPGKPRAGDQLRQHHAQWGSAWRHHHL